MRIVTLNTWKCDGDYDRRLVRMADGLGALVPDVVCLQECFAAPTEGADTARALAQATGLRVLATPNRSKLRTFRGRPVTSSSGLAVLVDDDEARLSVLRLPPEQRDPDRVAQLVRLSTRWGACVVANLHLTHVRHAETTRRRQLEAVLSAVDAVRGRAPALICGDFNASPVDAALLPLRQRRDLDWGTPDPAALPSTLPHARGAGAVDHVLLLGGGAWSWRLRGRTNVLDAADGDGVRPSDHAGVLVDVETAPQNRATRRFAHSRQASRGAGEVLRRRISRFS